MRVGTLTETLAILSYLSTLVPLGLLASNIHISSTFARASHELFGYFLVRTWDILNENREPAYIYAQVERAVPEKIFGICVLQFFLQKNNRRNFLLLYFSVHKIFTWAEHQVLEYIFFGGVAHTY
jgi:hypothetical protein